MQASKLRPTALLLALVVASALSIWTLAPDSAAPTLDPLTPGQAAEQVAPSPSRALSVAEQDERAIEKGAAEAELTETHEQAPKRSSAAPRRGRFRISGTLSAIDDSLLRSGQVFIRKERRKGARQGFRIELPLHPRKLPKHGASFELGVPGAGRYQVWARSKDAHHLSHLTDTSQVASLTLSEQQPVAEIELVLGEIIAIEGRVVTESGAPLAGVRLTTRIDPETRTSGDLRLFSDGQRFRTPGARSDASGHFRIDPLHPDTPAMRVDVHLTDEHLGAILGKGAVGRGATALKSFGVNDVLPGTTDLVIRVKASELLGSSLNVELLLGGNAPLPPGISFKLTRVNESGKKIAEVHGLKRLTEEPRFTLEGLEAGSRYTLKLIDGLYNPIDVLGPFRVVRGEQTVQVAFHPATPVQLHARTTSGNSVHGAKYTVERINDVQAQMPQPGGKPAKVHRHRCPGGRNRIAPGSYLARAQWKNLIGEAVLEVGREPSELTIELEPLARKRGRAK